MLHVYCLLGSAIFDDSSFTHFLGHMGSRPIEEFHHQVQLCEIQYFTLQCLLQAQGGLLIPSFAITDINAIFSM
jgi:hypothetical protein